MFLPRCSKSLEISTSSFGLVLHNSSEVEERASVAACWVTCCWGQTPRGVRRMNGHFVAIQLPNTGLGYRENVCACVCVFVVLFVFICVLAAPWRLTLASKQPNQTELVTQKQIAVRRPFTGLNTAFRERNAPPPPSPIGQSSSAKQKTAVVFRGKNKITQGEGGHSRRSGNEEVFFKKKPASAHPRECLCYSATLLLSLPATGGSECGASQGKRRYHSAL